MTVIRWIKDGKIPAFRTAGGHRRILRGDLDAFCRTRGIPLLTDGASRHVVIVDPDATTREAITEAVRAADASLVIEVAADAFSGGRLTAELRPDLLFIDQRMPGVDVLDLCTRLSAEAGEAPTIIVIVSAMSPDVERAFRSRGATGCIARPPVKDVVERLVRARFSPQAEHPALRAVVIDADGERWRALRDELAELAPGCALTLCESVAEGLLAIEQQPQDVVIFDADHSVTNLLETVPRLGSRPGKPPVIVATGDGDGARAASLSGGARHYLPRPFGARELMPFLTRMARRRRT